MKVFAGSGKSNSIAWLYNDETSSVAITYSDVQGHASGAGNIDAMCELLRIRYLRVPEVMTDDLFAREC